MGQAAHAGLEYEVIALVEAFANEDSGAFASQGGKLVSIAQIMGRGSRPSIMS